VQVNRVVDRLVRDRFFGVIGPHGAQYVRNLLRRPELLQIVPYYLKKRAVRMELERTARRHTPRVALQVSRVGVIGARARCPSQFAADRTRRTAKAFSNRPDAALVVAHGHHDGTLLRRQMGIDSGYGGTLQERVLHLVLEAAMC